LNKIFRENPLVIVLYIGLIVEIYFYCGYKTPTYYVSYKALLQFLSFLVTYNLPRRYDQDPDENGQEAKSLDL
jgi:hypothetical protein